MLVVTSSSSYGSLGYGQDSSAVRLVPLNPKPLNPKPLNPKRGLWLHQLAVRVMGQRMTSWECADKVGLDPRFRGLGFRICQDSTIPTNQGIYPS